MRGFNLPDRRPAITDAELAWLTFLRSMCPDRVPDPTLRSIQALRLALVPAGHSLTGNVTTSAGGNL